MKKRRTIFFVLMLSIAFGFSFAQAQESNEQRNSSLYGPEIIKPNPKPQININQQNGVMAGCNVLILQADGDTPGNCHIQTLLQSYGDLGAVDMYEARYGTPTLAELLAYDVVITWCNYAYFDDVAAGNVLADYVDNGGKVINTVWTMGTSGNELQGRFIDENYTAAKGLNYGGSLTCLGVYDSGHPIMNGITNVCDLWRINDTYLTPGSSAVADYIDGLIFVAVKDNGSVVTINGYVGEVYQYTGQMPDVLHNSILWLCGIQPHEIPLSNWALGIGIFLIVAATLFRVRRYF